MKNIFITTILSSVLLSGCDYVSKDTVTPPVENNDTVTIIPEDHIDSEETGVVVPESPEVLDKDEDLEMPLSETVSLTAEELYDDYRTNENEAKLKYDNVLLSVTGMIDKIIISSEKNKAVVFFKTPNSEDNVMATGGKAFTESVSGFRDLETITVLCQNNGVVTRTPQLIDCIVQ